MILLLALLLAACAATDIAQRRIPNAFSATVAILGIANSFIRRDGTALSGVIAGLAVLAVFTLAGLFGMVGGGDVKLAAASATWVGFRQLPFYLCAIAFAGGVVLLPTLVAWWRAPPEGRSSRPTVPYGIAIAIGALAAVLKG